MASLNVRFHGAYKSKRSAKAKEKKVHGFIRAYKINGRVKYVVMTKERE